MKPAVLVRGGGEMATGVAVTLHRAGWCVAVAEIARPRALRRTVAFAEAVYRGEVEVEGVRGRCTGPGDLARAWDEECVPVVVDPDAGLLRAFSFEALVDAILSKRNAGKTRVGMAPVVVGLGPGFEAGVDCDLVVETGRDHFLGRVYDRGSASADTGVPGDIGGESERRVVRSPRAGSVEPRRSIGDRVAAGDVVARVAGADARTLIAGVMRGIVAPGLEVTGGEKIADVDPRGRPEYCRYVSDKARLVGAGVLLALAWHRSGRSGRWPAPPGG